MSYLVKEIFYTLQGEGSHTGRPAVFLRFAGCNLWSGQERDRRAAICKFCDTDFVGGQEYKTAAQLAAAVGAAWPGGLSRRFVVITGGEPALQFDADLRKELLARHFFIAMETNGSLPLKADPDWLTVSPKTKTLRITDGDELKLVYPTLPPELFADLSFRIFSLQPKAERWRTRRNTKQAIAYCKANPQWRLSMQMHKMVGIP